MCAGNNRASCKKRLMKIFLFVAIFFFGILYTISSLRAGVSPPPESPPGSVLGPAQATNLSDPGDNDGAVGRTYIVQKANIQASPTLPNEAGFTFTTRSNPPQVTTYTDSQFWNVMGPNGTTFVPQGDGRIVYDPYGAIGCTTTGGRWIAVERGKLCNSGCTSYNYAMAVGVSTGENPLPSNPPTQNWTFQFYPSPISNPPTQAVMDQPRIGFNTNWIAATVDSYDSNDDSALYVWPKYDAECSADLTTSLFTFAALNTQLGRSLSRSCVAETYFTGGQDLDGSTLYLLTPNDMTSNGMVSLTADSICISSITGTSEAPIYTPDISCPVEANNIWATYLPNGLSQPLTSQKIDVPLDIDRFTSCVVRNYGIWAAQQIGLPAASPASVAVQWWNVGVDGLLGNVYQFQQIGAGSDSLTDNAIFPSIGVNYYSDLLIGFTQVSSNIAASSAYMYKDQHDLTQNSIYTYSPGSAPYVAAASPQNRLGDYSHSTDDPGDDFTLWTTEGFSNSQLTSSPVTYGWQSSYAFVYPRTTPYYVSYSTATKTICTAPAGQDCVVNVPVPSGVQNGDVVLAAITMGGYFPKPATPPDSTWMVLPISNLGNDTFMDQGSCNTGGYIDLQTEYVFAHVYNGETGTYTFKHVNETYCNGYSPQLEGDIFVYRGAITNLGNLLLYGFPDNYSDTIVVGSSTNPPVSPSVGTLVNVFYSAGSPGDPTEFQDDWALGTQTPPQTD